VSGDSSGGFNLSTEVAKLGLSWFQVIVLAIGATQITILISSTVTASKVSDIAKNDEAQDRKIEKIEDKQSVQELYVKVLEADIKGRLRELNKHVIR
jgi:anaerobic C4-dicarboxylate transporter